MQESILVNAEKYKSGCEKPSFALGLAGWYGLLTKAADSNTSRTTRRILPEACSLISSGALAQTADTIYHNGAILTMAGKEPAYVDALVVKDGKIAFVGNEQSAFSMKGDSTRIVDLEGKALLPGFLDAHSHYINSLLVANQAMLYAPPSGPGKDVPSIIATLKEFASEHQIPKGELIIGYGYDDTVMPDARLLNRGDLDEAFPDDPVRVDHVSMHGAVLNSLALEKYGISAATRIPPGGVIVRKPDSEEPWGLIMETAFLPVFEQSEEMTAQQEIEWSRAGQMLYAQAGITTAQDLANSMVKKVYDMNVPLLLHCNGDAAIDAFLTAYEFARAGDYARPWNVTTIHTQFMRKDQIPKFVEYKVRPSFFTLHTFYFAEAHLRIVAGSRRCTSARCETLSTPGSAPAITQTSWSPPSTR